MGKLAQRRDEEHRFDRAEYDHYEDGKRGLFADAPEIRCEQQRRHEHRCGDGKPICRFHACAGAEVQHDRRAAEIQHEIDRADIDLPLGVGGIAHLEMRQ